MPAAPKSTAAPVNGAGSKGKTAKAASPSASGTATPVSKVDDDKAATALRVGRPDKAAYDAEQEKLKKEIDVLQTKLVSTCLAPVSALRRDDCSCWSECRAREHQLNVRLWTEQREA